MHIKGNLLRAAQKVVDTSSPESSFQRIWLTPDNQVQSCNGSAAFSAGLSGPDADDFFINEPIGMRFYQTIPTCDFIQIDLIDENRGFALCYSLKENSKETLLAFSIDESVDAFSVNSIFPISPIHAVSKISLTAANMGLIEKVYGADKGVTIEYRDMSSIIVIKPNHHSDDKTDQWPGGASLLIIPMVDNSGE